LLLQGFVFILVAFLHDGIERCVVLFHETDKIVPSPFSGCRAQRSEEFVLIDERLAVEDDTAAVVEIQLQQIIAHNTGVSDPFQSVSLFHIVSIKWVNL